MDKLYSKLFELALRTAKEPYQAHAHTQALYLLHVSTGADLSVAVHIAMVSLQTE